jgi:hypothetical protein
MMSHWLQSLVAVAYQLPSGHISVNYRIPTHVYEYTTVDEGGAFCGKGTILKRISNGFYLYEKI